MKASKCLLIALGIIFLSCPCYAVPVIDLVISETDLTVGDTFNFNVVANGVTDVDPWWGCADELLSFGFDLDYDTAAFAYNGATIGGAFIDDSDFLDNVEIAGSAFPGIGGNDILLASLSFTALTAGEDLSLGIISDIFNPNQGVTTLMYWDDPFMGNMKIDMTGIVSLSVTGSTPPVPEPSTMILVGTAILFGLAGTEKYRRTS